MLYLYHVAYITAHSSLDSVIDKQNPCAVGRLNIFVIYHYEYKGDQPSISTHCHSIIF